ncbi:MAG: hypothetical protein A2X35_05575 [Elusimicrobia bacterium GWA2_61_42]|nr:MAG: hypothetical protein A2X35_05575 [Elusimicrobia bacterium GWA2_61_42]OGR74164.1 MAG: hypothetical protein A2X38_11090 [Elusimicrobia bacterium GWC2_61_25]
MRGRLILLAGLGAMALGLAAFLLLRRETPPLPPPQRLNPRIEPLTMEIERANVEDLRQQVLRDFFAGVSTAPVLPGAAAAAPLSP